MESKEFKEKKGLREFFLSTLSVDNSTSVFIITFIILLFGYWGYEDMPKEQFPEVSIPTIFVNTPYPGNSAVDIENLVTRPLEKEIGNISEVRKITSTSVQDFSNVVVEFNTDVDIDFASRKVKDAVDRAKGDLPKDLPTDPTVLDINLSELPILTINISGEYTNDELKSFAEYLQDEVEKLPEISSAEIKGAMDREMEILVHPFKMQSLKVSFADIENAVKAENITLSGGELVNDDFRRAVRVEGEFKDAEQLGNMIVKSEKNNPIYLKDIATVRFGYKERSSIARSDLLPVISLDVIKRKGENLLSASDQINEIVAHAQAKVFPSDLKISVFNDQSVNTRREVKNLENSIISGVILVVLVLLFFMGIRNSLFVGIAIPLSMLLGILVLYVAGITLNMVVLFGLILALGMLVDNGIVIVENIYRYRQEGYGAIEAAKYGAGEVAVPIIASTATTLAAFFPLAFWPGLMGSFMKYLPITLIAVLTSSLLVALIINPVLTATFMKVDERAQTPEGRRKKKINGLKAAGYIAALALVFHFFGKDPLRNLSAIAALVTLLNVFLLRPLSFAFQNSFLPRLESFYYGTGKWVLKKWNSLGVFLGTFLLLFLALALLAIKTPKVIFFPDTEPTFVNVFVELPLGTDIEKTDRVMLSLEKKVAFLMEKYGTVVESILSQIGENTSDPSGPPEPGSSPHKGRITVSFVPYSERDGISTWALMEEIRQELRGYPGVKIVVDKNSSGPPTGKPINIEVSGDDLEQLVELSEILVSDLKNLNIPGIEELKADVTIGKPELLVKIDREAARKYGVSTFSIAEAIRTAIYGKEISKYKMGEDEFPIFLRLENRFKEDVNDVMNQLITFRDPASGRISQVPISAVSNLEYTSTYSSVKRKEQKRMITVFSNVLDGYNANEIVEELKDYMATYQLPQGFSYTFTGEQEEQADATDFLGTALLIAIFSIFLIIVAQFNSILSPFIIMLSVLFSTIGVFLGLALTGSDIVIVMTGVGIISLAGVVVNNAIVLIDYTNLTIRRKREAMGLPNGTLPYGLVKQSIIEAGATRLRPVLLTAITTILGLIPLATGFNFDFFGLISNLDPNIYMGGESADFWSSMAWTVIYGLTFATFLTLIVVPVMYWLFYRLKYWTIGKLGGQSPETFDYSTVAKNQLTDNQGF
jgi:multidrug efflux pump